MNRQHTEELVDTLIKMHDYIADGRIFLAREVLEDLLYDLTGKSYAPTDS
jgi:hypothetical protein